jgi:hypothetical protein
MPAKGFIVVIDNHGVGELTTEPILPGDKTWPVEGLLLDSDNATLFLSNLKAHAAIQRTVRYAIVRRKKHWPTLEDYRVVPVV